MIHVLRKIRRSDLKILAAVIAITLALVGFASACSTDADVVNKNITQDADNFKVPRRITFINGITDKVELTVTGYCAVEPGDPLKITVTCARNGGYIRQYLLKSDNVFGVIDQLDPAQVSPNYYKSTIKPSTAIPDIELR
jgi:hypothetical protein